ncbi:hypothetical protein SAMN05421810_108259 [Amycolatopsis arida]|uniref:Uncharacterized protein n=1 Tax=Amycolatopsis arida TaxID=587909 RepID=A0A1I5Z5Y9_9PSEU|nr:hypothetical protein [Amycolatopsis arida]TDX90170.1 hypothetical protein CLV69_108259 [Amycolatopsis arida]SFQ51889.1 hypothetical protein SAMN05421810_108259 [Amycolatopsis arida]
MSEHAHTHEHRPDPPDGAGSFSLLSYVEREEARRAETGPTLDEWLASIEEFRIPDITRESIVATIREVRDAENPREVDR